VSTETNRKGRFGPLYKGHEGQYSWLLHRVSGVAIILFLFAHVVDTAVVGWGPDAYNRVASVYHNPFIRLLELGLVAAVLFHSINGVRITLIDFFPGLTRHARALGIISVLLFVAAMIPITWIMGTAIIDLIGEG
jgi:succinate dehydrogenase / fumarate reductase cytochrome b subunit